MENVATEEFISRTEALKDFESCNAENPNWTPQRVKTLLLRQPAADVAPVVHGRWLEEKRQTLLPVEYDDVGEPILHDYVVYRCDRCERTCKQKEPYCHCGAKMEDGVNE
jgi:hypothetical protein